ncbi:unnamed protein product [Owenia fusiformis]|uniref:Exonuclease V n=1 Tax=Owenia fusiformis TaxID=6347 RepID=A0A8S4QAB0_OWEFU|nr:unnamed protein product [Owenia fusiformis]
MTLIKMCSKAEEQSMKIISEKGSTSNKENDADDIWEDSLEDDYLVAAADFFEERAKLPQDPLHTIRGGMLWVTDFVGQAWCEQQMFYKLRPPLDEMGDVIIEDLANKPSVKAGTDMHAERELEIQTPVQVDVTCREDKYAIKLLNMIIAANSLMQGHSRREIPIFGMPSNHGVFIVGIIDEIRCDPNTQELDLVEFKTRESNSTPGNAQKKTHEMQLCIYNQMWDELVTGKFYDKEAYAHHLRLDLTAELGAGVLNEIRSATIDAFHVKNLDQLLDVCFSHMRHLTCINQIYIEYTFQRDKSLIGIEEVLFNEKVFNQKMAHAISYWKGERTIDGVDIEDAWKCKKCDFGEVCVWRKKKAEECAEKNNNKRLRVQ